MLSVNFIARMCGIVLEHVMLHSHVCTIVLSLELKISGFIETFIILAYRNIIWVALTYFLCT